MRQLRLFRKKTFQISFHTPIRRLKTKMASFSSPKTLRSKTLRPRASVRWTVDLVDGPLYYTVGCLTLTFDPGLLKMCLMLVNPFTAVRTYDVHPNLSSDNSVRTYIVRSFRGGIIPRPNRCCINVIIVN